MIELKMKIDNDHCVQRMSGIFASIAQTFIVEIKKRAYARF